MLACITSSLPCPICLYFVHSKQKIYLGWMGQQCTEYKLRLQNEYFNSAWLFYIQHLVTHLWCTMTYSEFTFWHIYFIQNIFGDIFKTQIKHSSTHPEHIWWHIHNILWHIQNTQWHIQNTWWHIQNTVTHSEHMATHSEHSATFRTHGNIWRHIQNTQWHIQNTWWYIQNTLWHIQKTWRHIQNTVTC